MSIFPPSARPLLLHLHLIDLTEALKQAPKQRGARAPPPPKAFPMGVKGLPVESWKPKIHQLRQGALLEETLRSIVYHILGMSGE